MKVALYLALGLIAVLAAFIIVSAVIFAVQLLIWVIGVALVVWVIIEISKYCSKEKDKPPE